MNVVQEIIKLKNQVAKLILDQSNKDKYMQYDIESGRINTAKAQRACDENTESIGGIEEQLTVADDTVIELYELQLTQEEINSAQDDALIEIYEMLGGEA